MERLCLSSFLYHGHEFHLYTYDDVREVPEGVIVKDADRILSREKIFKYKNFDSYSGFSNLFRYKLLLENGGYWVDMDMICLRSFTEQPTYLFCSERINNWQRQRHITSSLIKVPTGSEIMEYCYAQAARRDPASLEWGDTGPKLMNQAVHRFGLQDRVAQPAEFCPVNYWQWHRLISGSRFVNWLETKRLDTSQCVHLWNEMWRRNDVNKDRDFPENCLYEQLKRKYLSPLPPTTD